MSKVFMIDGLGADCRLYQNIDLPGHEVINAEWIVPENRDTLITYAQKLIDNYRIMQNDVVIGDSLGGILAVEIAKKINLSKTIIISSIKISSEAPWYFKIFRRLPVYQLIPGKWMVASGFLIRYIFGDMAPQDLELFKSMLMNSSPAFMKWAMGAVLKWRNNQIPANLYHITGNRDIVFPHHNIVGATIVDGGTHIMIFDKAAEINILLQKILG